MKRRWLGLGAALLLGGCAHVEWAEKYPVTSFPEVSLGASEANPAKVKFATSDEKLDALVQSLKAQFGKRKDFKVVEENADYWFILSGAESYARGAAHKKITKASQESGNGGKDVIQSEDVTCASAAKNVSVAVYRAKNLTPVHYLEIPLYTGGSAAAKSEADYAKAFSQDTVERIMDVFLTQQKEVKTPMPKEANSALRALFEKQDYAAFEAKYKAVHAVPVDLKKLYAAMRADEDGKATEADKALLKDLDVKLGDYYLSLLVRETKTLDAEELRKIYDEQLLVLEMTEASGLVESCPVALARLEYKLANVEE